MAVSISSSGCSVCSTGSTSTSGRARVSSRGPSTPTRPSPAAGLRQLQLSSRGQLFEPSQSPMQLRSLRSPHKVNNGCTTSVGQLVLVPEHSSAMSQPPATAGRHTYDEGRYASAGQVALLPLQLS